MKKAKNPLEDIAKNLKYLVLGIIILFLFKERVVMIISMIIFAFLGLLTIQISRVVPHISAETVTPAAILIGYLWGWPWGLAFGIIVGLIGFMRASLINLTVLIVIFLMGFSGVMGALFGALGFPFWQAYLLSYFARANLGFFIMQTMGQSMMENISHSYIESVYNMVIIIHFMNIFYAIISTFV